MRGKADKVDPDNKCRMDLNLILRRWKRFCSLLPHAIAMPLCPFHRISLTPTVRFSVGNNAVAA